MNNYEKTREVLEGLNSLFESGAICTSYMNTAEETWQIEELYRKAQAALALPPRQCDVGTAEEQSDRFMEYCNARKDKPGKCKNCVFNESVNICAIEWAQMPYEQEGAEHGEA